MLAQVGTPDVWRFQAHPDVWALIAGIVALGCYATRVIGPKVVRDGSPIVTRRQKRWFALAVLVLWAGADWPIHDVAEQYLYSVHMFQHLLFTMVAAPLFLLATPTWLARLVVGDGWIAGGVIRRLCKPVVAGVIYNAALVFTHWQSAVNQSVASSPIHYSLHLLFFSTALLMWMPVCGPLPELRLSIPGQMVYLFAQSIVPTVPSAWLIFAESPIYKAYVHPFTVWGMNAVDDQATAGVLMKLGAGTFLWVLITVLFFRWAHRHMEAERAGVVVTEKDVLTWDDVERELEAAPPAPAEPTP